MKNTEAYPTHIRRTERGERKRCRMKTRKKQGRPIYQFHFCTYTNVVVEGLFKLALPSSRVDQRTQIWVSIVGKTDIEIVSI